MWRKTRLCAMAFLLLALCLCWPCAGSCSEAQAEQDTLTISKMDWERLKQNNAEQKKALEESQKELKEAREAQSESEKALTEAKLLLNLSQMSSSEMQDMLTQLLNESATQRAEIEKLKTELKDAKSESLTAYESIAKANQYLSDTKKEIEANEAAWRKRENQLERQRLEWQIASVLFGYIGYEIGRH